MASFTRNIQRVVAALSGPAARCAATPSAAPSASASLIGLGLTRLVASHQLPCTATRFSSALAAGRFSAGEEKSQLVQLLEKEIEHEKEHAMPEDEEEVLDFFKKSGWKVQKKEGNDDVTLSRAFGKENVDVTFSLSEMNQQEDYNEIDEEEIEEGDDEQVLTVHAMVNCEKPGHGTLTFDVTFEQGEVYVHNASHYPSADVAKMKNAEADWQRRSLYPGPVFSELEEDLQNTFSQYLQERGVDNDLAVFAVKYASLGEQREYFNWLHRVRDHLRA